MLGEELRDLLVDVPLVRPLVAQAGHLDVFHFVSFLDEAVAVVARPLDGQDALRHPEPILARVAPDFDAFVRELPYLGLRGRHYRNGRRNGTKQAAGRRHCKSSCAQLKMIPGDGSLSYNTDC